MSEFSYNKEKYKDYARKMAKQYNLPTHLFLGQLEQESNWNPKAKSHAGAVGIGQFMPNIHKVGSWKFKSKEDYFDPYKSIESAAMFMSNLKNKYNGNYMAALAHYNGGGRQGQLVAQGKQPSYSETAKYIQLIPQKAEKYNVEPQAPVQQQPLPQQVPQTPEQVIQQSQVPKPVEQPKTQATPQPQQAPKPRGDRNAMMQRIAEYLNQSQQQPKTPARPQMPIPSPEPLITRPMPQAMTPVPQQAPQQLPNRGQLFKDIGQSLQNFRLPTSQYQQIPNIQYRPSQGGMPQVQTPSMNKAWQQRRGI